MTLTVGSLFSGIGGIDLGLERAGMKVLWHSEIEPYACKVLKKHWPHVPNLGDIRTINWETVPYVDIIAGGYPCQPFSLAGNRAGRDDPRHLWPCFADALRRVRPRFALLENVAAHLTLGFGEVLADLAALGYDTRWDCIPAAAIGAPHLRDRVFVIAARQDVGTEQRWSLADSDNRRELHSLLSGWNAPWDGGPFMAYPDNELAQTRAQKGRHESVRCSAPVAYPDCSGSQGRTDSAHPEREGADRYGWQGCRWETEPDVGRVADGVPHRMDRLRGLGNAVVPQVAEYLGWIIRSIA